MPKISGFVVQDAPKRKKLAQSGGFATNFKFPAQMPPLADDPDMPGLLSPDSDSDSDGALSPTLPDLFGRPTPDVEAATEDARSDATLSPQRPGPWALFGRMEGGDDAMKFPPTRILVPSYVQFLFACLHVHTHALFLTGTSALAAASPRRSSRRTQGPTNSSRLLARHRTPPSCNFLATSYGSGKTLYGSGKT